MSDEDDYLKAQQLQQMMKNLGASIKPTSHLGVAGEKCPTCGHEIETLLNKDGRNPMRLCWKCEIDAVENEAKRQEEQQE